MVKRRQQSLAAGSSNQHVVRATLIVGDAFGCDHYPLQSATANVVNTVSTDNIDVTGASSSYCAPVMTQVCERAAEQRAFRPADR